MQIQFLHIEKELDAEAKTQLWQVKYVIEIGTTDIVVTKVSKYISS